MGYMILIILIGLYAWNKKSLSEMLKAENMKLKQEILYLKEKLKGYNATDQKEYKQELKTEIAEPVKEKVEEVRNIPTQEEIREQNELREKKERESKNTFILITGAILIVLAAIVFLMSTWSTISDLLKTAVLVLLVGVFLGGSKIAKDNFKLENASRAFFYIAMAYIPICLISISIFSLFGEYMSIQGEGKYIYLTFCGIFISTLYYMTYNSRKSVVLLYGSILSQLFSIILFSLIFETNMKLIGINLLIYNIALILLTKSKEENIFEYVYNAIPYIISFFTMFALWETSGQVVVLLALIVLNFIILELNQSKILHAYIFNIALNVLGLYIINQYKLELELPTRQILSLMYVLLVFVLQNVFLFGKDRVNLKKSCTVVNLVILAGLHIHSFSSDVFIIKPYVIAILELIMLIISYIESKEIGKKITSYLIPIYFIIAGLNFIDSFDGTYHYYIILALLTFVVGQIIRGEGVEKLNKGWFLVSHVHMLLTYLVVSIINSTEFSDDVMYYILLMVIYIYSYMMCRYRIFKYATYVSGNIVLLSANEFFISDSDFVYFIPVITTLGVMYLEKIYTYLKDDFSLIYITISKCIAYLTLVSLGTDISIIVTLMFTGYLIYDNMKSKERYIWNIVPLFGAMPAIFNNDLDISLQLGIMFLSVAGLSYLSIKDKKIGMYTIFSAIYLMFTMSNITSDYLNAILFICWSVLHLYYMENLKQKDIFRFLAYIGILILYYLIADDLRLLDYTLFSMMGVIVFAIMVIRTMAIKYVANIDIYEYLTFTFLYLVALFSYSGEPDGMMFILLVVGIIILSYTKKYGALFITSIFAVLANVFFLTREFWFSMPWWVYLLVIGTILISFAIRNEAQENKEKINFKTVVKSLKNKCER